MAHDIKTHHSYQTKHDAKQTSYCKEEYRFFRGTLHIQNRRHKNVVKVQILSIFQNGIEHPILQNPKYVELISYQEVSKAL